MKQILKVLKDDREVVIKTKEVKKVLEGKEYRVIEDVKEIQNVEYGQVVFATPSLPTPQDPKQTPYIRLQYVDGPSYKWGAPLKDYNDQIMEDDPRWVAE